MDGCNCCTLARLRSGLPPVSALPPGIGLRAAPASTPRARKYGVVLFEDPSSWKNTSSCVAASMVTPPNNGGSIWPARSATTGSQPRTRIVFEDASSPSLRRPADVGHHRAAELRACSACLRAASAAAARVGHGSTDRRDDVMMPPRARGACAVPGQRQMHAPVLPGLPASA